MRKLMPLLLVLAVSFVACWNSDSTAPPAATPIPTMPPEPVGTPAPEPKACVTVPGPGGAGQLWKGDCQSSSTCRYRGDDLYSGACVTVSK